MEPFADNYDAVVVGARCAGASTALLLARRGLSVLLVDRHRHGADTLSTLAMMRAGVLQLHRWGLLERLVTTGGRAIHSTTFFYADEAITVPIKPRDGVDALYAPRRTLLDPLLADAAAEAGADVRFGIRLSDLTHANGRVNGVILEDRDRARHTIRAGIVIGADGVHSAVARCVGAQPYLQGRNTCGVVYAFWRGLENRGNRWYYRPGVSVGAIPSNDDNTCVFAVTPSKRFHEEIHADIETGYHRVMSECNPELLQELSGATLAERYRGFPGLPGYLRQSHGPGWALVGDAGYFKDPITAHGITDALRDAELLARAVEQGTDAALVRYQESRDELVRGMLDVTDRISSFEWDLDSARELHLELSREMNRETKFILDLEPLSVPAVS